MDALDVHSEYLERRDQEVEETMWMACEHCQRICEFAYSEKLKKWYCLECLFIKGG